MIEIFNVFKNTKDVVALGGKFPIYILGDKFNTKYLKVLEVEFKATTMLDMVLERQSFTKTLVLEIQDNKGITNYPDKFKVRVFTQENSKNLNFYFYKYMNVNLDLIDTSKYFKLPEYFGVGRNRLNILYNIQKDLNILTNSIAPNIKFKIENGTYIKKLFKGETFCLNTKTFDLVDLPLDLKVIKILNTTLE